MTGSDDSEVDKRKKEALEDILHIDSNLDAGVLAAFHLLLNNSKTGVSAVDLEKISAYRGCIILIGKGYARIDPGNKERCSKYYLTKHGEDIFKQFLEQNKKYD